MGKRTLSEDIALVKDNLNNRAIVLVGLMGAGKTSVGRRLAEKLDLPFVDADAEIERAAGKSIPEIFADHGEASFREGEKRVIARLLENGAQVLATGGGAYMNEETRALISNHGLALWLRADLELLLKRVAKRDNRPLLKQGDPREVMQALIDKRYPIYGLADIIVDSQDAQHSQTVNDVIRALASWPRIVMDLQNEEAGLQMPDDKIQVPVALGSRSYTIDIGHGLLSQSGTIVGQHLQRPFVAIVTDANVAPLHLKTLESALLAHGIKSHAITLPAGEGTKSYAQLAHLCDHLLGAGVERRDVVITLGGGVIGDLGGFAASIIRRGVNFIQVPTTLLSQVDSSVGGKTGINSGHGKNLVGTFHQPIHVIINLSLLKTLPAREQAAGYAEVAKYGLLGDSAFFDWLEGNGRRVMSCEADALLQAVETSCAMKARIVAADETETTGQRALLNLGHTFGHAYEAATGYSSTLLHGESVAIGMVQAFRFSERLGHCAKGVAERVERHLASVGLPTRVGHIKAMLPPSERLLELMRQDKKAVGGKLTFILVRGVGEAFVAKDVPDHQVLDFLEEDAQRP